MASDGREERRRKILERGSDRLAQITGLTKSALDPSPSPSTRSHDHPQINARPEDADGKYAPEDPNLHNIVASAATVGAPGSNNMTRKQDVGVQLPAQKLSNRLNFFSSKQINTCILSSERTRVVCSLIVASLVVMYPLLGINIVHSESVIAYRPLYILLLTDVMIVLTHMFCERASTFEEAEEVRLPHHDGDNWAGAVKLLERGLVMYQAIRGIFIDCSVYLVVVICFLSVV